MARTISIDDSWKDRLQTWGKPPRPKGNLNNCLIALRHSPEWRGVLVYNEFTHRIYKRRPTPWASRIGEWTDSDTRRAAAWFQAEDIEVGTATAADAIQTAAEDQHFNPLIEYLTGLEWDGYARVDTWLRDYLSVPFSDYSCAVGRAWLISAVARVMQPGCKADHCLILEGPQGRGKSSALRALAGGDYFSDYISSDLGSKEASILCQGKWIIEFSELEGVMHNTAKVETVKAFLSRSEDTYRPIYGRYSVTIPRCCIFAATTNKESYMPDESGNRRFWPVTVDAVDIPGIERDRDQLWAEAYRLYIDGALYWLDEDMEAQARREQLTRYEGDPWQDTIERYLLKKTEITVGEILEAAIHKDSKECTKADQMRVARCLQAIGCWKRSRSRNVRVYRRT